MSLTRYLWKKNIYETFACADGGDAEPRKPIMSASGPSILGPDYPLIGRYMTCDGPNGSWKRTDGSLDENGRLRLQEVDQSTLDACIANTNERLSQYYFSMNPGKSISALKDNANQFTAGTRFISMFESATNTNTLRKGGEDKAKAPDAPPATP